MIINPYAFSGGPPPTFDPSLYGTCIQYLTGADLAGSDGSSISTWVKNTFGTNATSTAGTVILKTNIINGYSVARFNNGQLQFSSIAAKSVLVITRPNDTAAVGILPGLFGASGIDFGLRRLYGGGFDAWVDTTVNDFPTLGRLRVNGVATTTQTDNTWGVVSARNSAPSNAINALGWYDPSRPYSGDLLAFVAWSDDLSDGNIAAAELAINAAFGNIF